MKAFRSVASVSSARAMLVPSMKSLSRVTTAIRTVVFENVVFENVVIAKVVIEKSAGSGWSRTSG